MVSLRQQKCEKCLYSITTLVCVGKMLYGKFVNLPHKTPHISGWVNENNIAVTKLMQVLQMKKT